MELCKHQVPKPLIRCFVKTYERKTLTYTNLLLFPLTLNQSRLVSVCQTYPVLNTMQAEIRYHKSQVIKKWIKGMH